MQDGPTALGQGALQEARGLWEGPPRWEPGHRRRPSAGSSPQASLARSGRQRLLRGLRHRPLPSPTAWSVGLEVPLGLPARQAEALPLSRGPSSQPQGAQCHKECSGAPLPPQGHSRQPQALGDDNTMRALTVASFFSMCRAASANTLATEEKEERAVVTRGRVAGHPGSCSAQSPPLTNDQARGGPAIGVLQEQGDDLDGVHQDAVPAGGGGPSAVKRLPILGLSPHLTKPRHNSGWPTAVSREATHVCPS